MADADVDGAIHLHATSDAVPSVYAGTGLRGSCVYTTMPPLLQSDAGKRKVKEYLYDDKAPERYRRTQSEALLCSVTKGWVRWMPLQLWETTLNPRTRMLKQIEIDNACGIGGDGSN